MLSEFKTLGWSVKLNFWSDLPASGFTCFRVLRSREVDEEVSIFGRVPLVDEGLELVVALDTDDRFLAHFNDFNDFKEFNESK